MCWPTRYLENGCYALLLVIAAFGVQPPGEARAQKLSFALRQNAKAGAEQSVVDFENLFVHVRSIPIRGTDARPIFELSDVAVRDSMVVVLDQQSATLSGFTLDGKFLYQVGRPGQGPGEFTNPVWVGFDARGRVAVLESMSNHRIQVLDPDTGSPLDVIAEDILVPPFSNAFIEGEVGAQRILFHTVASCGDGTGNRCLIQEHDLSSKKVIRRFAPAHEVNPEARSLPWIVGRDEAGRTYVSHVWGPDVVVHGADGTLLQRIDVRQASTFFPLEQSALPASRRAVFDALEGRAYSKIRSLTPAGQDLVVDHLYAAEEADTRKYLSVFRREGAYRASVSAPYLLRAVQGARLFFVEEDAGSDVGSYVIHEYRYRRM